jgi:phosphoglycolate phosphatase-like HAD superfamily hydrolase
MPTTYTLHPALTDFAPALVIFDKDGTLIDINLMWGGWIVEMAHRLESAAGRAMAASLFKTMAFDPHSGLIAPGGPLSIAPLAQQRRLMLGVLRDCGLLAAESETALAAAWHLPDPVKLAHPLANLTALFETLRAAGAKIGIATADDRASTLGTVTGLNLAHLVDAVICADDGLPIKPAPDMILSICRALDILPAKTVMVGDNVDDLRMGRAAGVGLTIGMVSGVSSRADLAPAADMVLGSVAELIIAS